MYSTLESKNYKLEQLEARQRITSCIIREKFGEIIMLLQERRSLQNQINRVIGSATKTVSIK